MKALGLDVGVASAGEEKEGSPRFIEITGKTAAEMMKVLAPMLREKFGLHEDESLEEIDPEKKPEAINSEGAEDES